MAELADAPDLGSGVLRRAGSSPVIRTTEKGTWSVPFFILPIKLTLDSVTLIWIIQILSIFWFDFYLLSLKSSIFVDFVDSSNTYSSADHPQPVNFVDPYSTYFPAGHQQPAFSLTPTALTFPKVIRTQEFSGNIKVTVPQLHISLLDSDSFIIGTESRHSSFHLNPSPVQHSLVFCLVASDKTDFRD